MEDDSSTIEDEMFIDDSDQEEEEDRSFYRDLNNTDNYPRFVNQTRNPVKVKNEPEEDYYGEDDMPELYGPENREEVNFDLKATRFKNSSVYFPNVENHFFKAVIYDIIHDKLNGENVELENAKETLGDKVFLKLNQIEGSVILDSSIFGFFERCCLINEILYVHNYFLRFYERRNKFRYQLRQKLKTKNEMRKELLSCAIQKFNGYELLRNHLNYGQRKDFITIEIVYEPTLDTKKTIFFFAPYIYLGFDTSVEKLKNRE